MSVIMKELGIDRLTREQQITLALDIWENLGEDLPKGKLTEEQRLMLDQRDAELDADPSLGLTREQVFDGLEDD